MTRFPALIAASVNGFIGDVERSLDGLPLIRDGDRARPFSAQAAAVRGDSRLTGGC
ncbi:hypothetical protein [Deinococcus sp.]|uniref:hypothetical protein n=1 Tax=Deinococcus sp. TaxID=47478 RepID=UPI002869DEB2|nr:hypothetical protein [Deinococcus sp.]